MRHDMAPMARRIADRQQDRFSGSPCCLERFVIPGLPVYRVVLLLHQVGTCFLGEVIAAHEL